MRGFAAVVLAAGQGSRFRAQGGSEPTKLVATMADQPIVRIVVTAALASLACPVIVVTGHAAAAVATALAGLDVRLVHNPDYASGLAGSLKVGIREAPDTVDGVAILLGDMPGVDPAVIDALLSAAEDQEGSVAVVPVSHGRRGNPVVLRRSLFAAVEMLQGDEGARRLLRSEIRVHEVPMATSAVTYDIDTPDDLLERPHQRS